MEIYVSPKKNSQAAASLLSPFLQLFLSTEATRGPPIFFVLHRSAPATHPLTVFPSPEANQQLELRLLPANNLLSPKSASNNLISLGILPSICSKQAVTLLFYFPHRTTPPFPFSPIDQQEASCSNIFSFPQSSQSACSLVVSLLSFPKQPPTPSLNFVYCNNQQLDPNPFSKNIKSASSSISMISCVGPLCARYHQQLLSSYDQSTQISKLVASF
jgi:hypothetical protein